MNRQLGFTLIELLVVIAIIAILAATAIPVYKRYVFQTNCASSVNQLSEAKLQVVKNINFGATDNCENTIDSGSFEGSAENCAAGPPVVLTASTVGTGEVACTAQLQTIDISVNPILWSAAHTETGPCGGSPCGFD